MSSLKPLRSTHGRQLLNLLSDLVVVGHDGHSTRPTISKLEEQLRDIISVDPLASRLADGETGNNAFHLIVSTNRLAPELIIRVLHILASNGPEGLKKVNKEGDLPIHLYLLQSRVSVEVVQCLVNFSPSSASASNTQGLIPLFLCTMREDISAEVVKVLCKVFPAGPSTQNATNSIPLHFAAKKLRPNKDIIRILLRRNPEGASCVNDHGLLPIHCVSSFAEDHEAVQMILEAYPTGVLVPDRLGRLPLHLAVLAIGNAHTQAIQADSEEAALQQRMEDLSLHGLQKENEEGEQNDTGFDDEDEDQTPKSTVPEWPLQERGQRSRRVVHYLARCCPISLCVRNNFEATPVDTVLSKVKPERSKRKIVAVFGLYDDPVTARWLLILHRESIRNQWNIFGALPNDSVDSRHRHLLGALPAKTMPPMIGRHVEELQELNWLARKPALLASYQGYSHHLLRSSMMTVSTGRSNATSVSKKSVASKSKLNGSSVGTLHAGTNKAGVTIGGNEEGCVHPHNLIGRLRNEGFADLVRYVMQYI